MTQSSPASPRKRGQGFWLTVGEVVGVLALVIAGLNFWESHQQHLEEVRLHSEDARREQVQSQAAAAFVAVGEADREGRSIELRPLKASQAIQSQRYVFAPELLDRPMDLTAESPRIEADWIAGGLKRALEAAHARASGEARAPVLLETVYVEDGDTRNDVSLYQIGFSWKRGFLGGWQIRLRGLALSKRGLTGDPAPLLEARWAAAKTALAPH